MRHPFYIEGEVVSKPAGSAVRLGGGFGIGSVFAGETPALPAFALPEYWEHPAPESNCREHGFVIRNLGAPASRRRIVATETVALPGDRGTDWKSVPLSTLCSFRSHDNFLKSPTAFCLTNISQLA